MSTLKVGTIQDPTNSNTAIGIDSSGVVSMTQNPLLKVVTSAGFTSEGSSSLNQYQNLDSTVINRGGWTVASTNGGRFTVPKTGYYHFEFLTFLDTNNDIRAYYLQVNKNGTLFDSYGHHSTKVTVATTHDACVYVDTFSLSANDYLEFKYRTYDNATSGTTLRAECHLRWIP